MKSMWRRLNAFYALPLIAVPTIFLFGILVWGGFNWSMELTNSESFCVSCHVMRDTVYPEYRTSVHYANRVGVKASCPDCHVPRDWMHKVIRKISATNELYHWLAGTIDTPAKFSAARAELAHKVWADMKATDSRECRNCHAVDAMDPAAQTPRAAHMHQLAQGWDMTCIDCHQGIAHQLPDGFDPEEVMDDIHDRIEREKVDCTLCHEKIRRSRDGDW